MKTYSIQQAIGSPATIIFYSPTDPFLNSPSPLLFSPLSLSPLFAA